MKNVFFIITIMLILAQSAFALEVEDLKVPKNPAYRVGVSNESVESEFIEVNRRENFLKSAAQKTKKNINTDNYFDLSLKRISKEITKEIDSENADMLGDIHILWAGAAQKSETIKFAMYKLSNPDENKPKESVIKKVIRPIASLTTIASAGFPNPIIATGAILSGNLLGAMSIDEKDLNYKLTKVNDADMIVLVRKIDDLQKNLVNNYLGYMSAKETLQLSYDIFKRREQFYMKSKNDTKEKMLIADAYYRESLDNLERNRIDFLTRRSALEQLVGNQTLKDFEDNLKSRDEY